MSRLIPVIYKNKKYPAHIEANIHELSGNFYKEKLIVKSSYSLHTEPSAVPKKFNSKIVNKFYCIKDAQRDNIPFLWYDEEWASEFYDYIDWLIGSNIPPDVLEIHPPFNEYCNSFNRFLDIFNVFYQKFKKKYSETKIFIENRFGTRLKTAKVWKSQPFLLSTRDSILEFCNVLLCNSSIDLKIALDYPQLFSAEVVKGIRAESSWMGENPLQLVEKIIKFNQDLKEYRKFIGSFHMWGKLKTGTGWTPHAGNFDTFFSNNDELKHKFLSSVFSTFNDGIVRYFVPEVNSGVSDLHSIVTDMENAGFIFTPNQTKK